MSDSLPILPSQPRIVPRAEHGISRKDISPNALRVLYRLRDGGFQGYLVGGAGSLRGRGRALMRFPAAMKLAILAPVLPVRHHAPFV